MRGKWYALVAQGILFGWGGARKKDAGAKSPAPFVFAPLAHIRSSEARTLSERSERIERAKRALEHFAENFSFSKKY